MDGVSFDIAPGETLGLVGESGSGKSTIGKAILGLQPASAGQVLLHGSDITRASLRQRRVTAIDLRVVFQDPYSSLNPAQTIGQTLTEPLRVLRVPKDQRRPKAAEALAAVGLPADAIDRYPAQFSGGQRQRIAIARALVCDPQVIVLDEPVSSLDVSTQAQVLNLLADLRDARGLALLFIAHDLGVVRFLAQRVVVLYRGQVMEYGPVEEVTQRPRHPYSIALTAAAPVPQPAAQARRRAAREALGIGTAGVTPPAAGGCPFATRCPLVTDVCRTERVPLTPAGDGSASGRGVGRRLPSRRPGRGNASGGRSQRQPFLMILQEITVQQFPDGFLWGVASAGHQNEGGNTDSDTWFAEHVRPTVFREPSGRACNGWELWREDIDLAAGMNLNAYRFSVEWARVEPAEGEFSAAALGHYAAMAALLRRARPRSRGDVQPLHLAALVRDARRLARPAGAGPVRQVLRPGDGRVRRADRLRGHAERARPARHARLVRAAAVVRDLERATLEAASAAAGVPRYRMSNVVLPEERDAICDGMTAGHRAARAAIKARRPGLPVGFALAVVDDQVYGDDPSLRDRKRAEVYQRWLDLAREDDFIAIQNYERHYYDAQRRVNPDGTPALGGPMSGRDPASLGCCARYAHQATGVPVLVTEHGMQTHDDAERSAFIEPSLRGLREAMADGVPVLGYHHWTLMDNYEWIFGYGEQLGLHSVDPETFARTAKPSAGVYASARR